MAMVCMNRACHWQSFDVWHQSFSSGWDGVMSEMSPFERENGKQENLFILSFRHPYNEIGGNGVVG